MHTKFSHVLLLQRPNVYEQTLLFLLENYEAVVLRKYIEKS